IAGIFNPNQERDEETTNTIKTNIVKMFDNALNSFEPLQKMSPEEAMKKILEDTQKLLEKTLKEFDNFNKELYA
ncbi:MAG: hypothetical protein U9N39_06340, partial [Campylobacterota bacterium]|nr:hypothetical protein [Campylobacterota bacterium]